MAYSWDGMYSGAYHCKGIIMNTEDPTSPQTLGVIIPASIKSASRPMTAPMSLNYAVFHKHLETCLTSCRRLFSNSETVSSATLQGKMNKDNIN